MQAQDHAELGDEIQPAAAQRDAGNAGGGGGVGGGLPTRSTNNNNNSNNAGLAIARQYSETSARVSFVLESRKSGKAGGKAGQQANLADLKRELEMWEHKVDVEELCSRIGTHARLGLSIEKAAIRLEQNGPNRLNPPKSTPWFVKLGAQFLDFFAILLQIASILCFVGYALDRSSSTNLYLGIILYAVVIATATFSFFQSYQADALMDKLQNFLPPKALVYRDGRSFSIDAAELVVGDLIEVKLGDKLPADIRIISNQKLKVDNSALTGESEPIGRTVDPTDDNPLETKNLAFFGTLAVDGTALGIVVNTGDDTVFGRIASLATRAGTETTTLQVDIHHFVVFISTISITIGLVTFILNVIDKVDWITNIVFAIGIIVAQVPEGLLATVTVSLSLSAKRMASKNVLVKKLEAVETLGSTTAICSDKTGTLTQNRMTVVHISYDMRLETTATPGQEASFDKTNPCFSKLFFIAACCGKAVFDEAELRSLPELPIDERTVNGDASEAGILKFAEKLSSVADFRARNHQVMTMPFNSTNKFMLTCNQVADEDNQLRLCMKGAPERVLDRCSYILTSEGLRPLDSVSRAAINEQLDFVMERGERALGFAMRDLDSNTYPPSFEFNTEEPNFPMEGLTFVGVMSLLDPPRDAVPEAVKLCQAAGIKVIMVTGDHPATAKSIAKQVHIIRDPTQEDIARERGIRPEDVDPADVKAIVVPGSQIVDLTESDWNRILAHEQIVFARTSPQQKLIIVENNQRVGHIVAVTGDGVNDSPALKKANIGIAMGIAGSDVSKEAADLILLDDNFASIVKGIEEGRLIFDNLKKSIAYTLVAKLPEIAPFIAFIFVKIPQAMSVILILSIDLGCDMLPAIALAFEPPEADIMLRKPRDASTDRLVNKRLASFSYLQIGVVQVLAGFLTFLIVLQDFGLAPSSLAGLDNSGYLSSVKDDKHRWLFTERTRYRGTSKRAVWFRNADGDFDFKRYYERQVPGFMQQVQENYKLIQPTADDTGKLSEFMNMVKIIGVETGRPPCVQFSCVLGGSSGARRVQNDRNCFVQPEASSNITITASDLLKDVRNPNIEPGLGRGQGCFELWTPNQQRAVIENGQTAFFIAVVVCQIACVIVCRTRLLSMFSQPLWSNKVLIAGIIQELALVLILAYVPPLNRVFKTRPIGFVHWLPGVPFAIFTFAYDEARKYLVRRGDSGNSKIGRWVRDNSYW